MRYRSIERSRRRGRFVTAVLIPVLVVALGLAAAAGFALHAAAEQADEVSAARQTHEVKLAVSDALDDLAQSQVGVAIWNPLVDQLARAQPDWNWIDANVGQWLNFDFQHDADFILAGDDTPVYAMMDGKRSAPARFRDFAGAIIPLINAVRGRVLRAPTPNERLPGKALHPAATVRTGSRAIHATQVALITGRPAAVSVMKIIPEEGTPRRTRRMAALLVSVRWLDAGFAARLAKVQLLRNAHFTRSSPVESNQSALALHGSDGALIGYMAWQPDRPGRRVWAAMAPSAALALAAFLIALAALILSVRKLLQRDAASLAQLGDAHLELKAREAQAHHLAFHDALTGLPNRAFFNTLADQAVATLSGEETLAILLLDLDRFKQVNDTLGHLGGDQLIKQVAERLQAVTGPEGMVSRLGGDEFAILLCGLPSIVEVESMAAAMVSAVREPFEVLGTKVFVGASIGIACQATCRADRSELLRMADIAMYRTKSQGRDGFCFFSADMDESVRFRREIERDLREALINGHGLVVHYQPQVDAAGARIVGLEALLRWNHPTRGHLTPQTFVPIAEETGLIHELGRWVLQQACAVARAWPDISVAVNLSPIQFRARDFASEVARIVVEAGASPRQIELEVTESVLLDNDDLIRGALSQLRKAGFRIALDDFGTGYSSLSYLRAFEVDKLKIDRSFTQGIGEANDTVAIIDAVVRLGHGLGLVVTAEGVETEAQRAFLREIGCNELQGFLFSAAIPQGEIGEALWRQKRSRAA